MLFSKSCIYGMRAALYLASRSDSKYISIKKVSEDLDISHHYLTKILQQLSNADLMESQKGPHGGVRLKKDEDELTLVEIVAAIDGMDLLTECALGLPGCGTEKLCPLHDQWVDTRDKIRKMLEGTTLNDLARKGKEGNLRITADGSFNWL